MELASRVWENTKESKVGKEKTVLLSPTMRMFFESEFKNMLYKYFLRWRHFIMINCHQIKKVIIFFNSYLFR